MVKLAVNGAMGRMGCRILSLAWASREFKIVGAFEHAGAESLGKDIGDLLGFGRQTGVTLSTMDDRAISKADAAIDFSSPESSGQMLSRCAWARTPLVIGTTGLGLKFKASIMRAAKKIPVLCSPNMSIGANFMFELSRIAATKLKEGYDIEIVEAHHRLKKDAPSGTARKLAEVIADQKGWKLARVGRYGREGLVGERPAEEIGIHAVRAGDIIGEHTVLFAGPGETIEITHRALSRDAFARGALVAALFLSKKQKGIFQMSDVLKVG